MYSTDDDQGFPERVIVTSQADIDEIEADIAKLKALRKAKMERRGGCEDVGLRVPSTIFRLESRHAILVLDCCNKIKVQAARNAALIPILPCRDFLHGLYNFWSPVV